MMFDHMLSLCPSASGLDTGRPRRLCRHRLAVLGSALLLFGFVCSVFSAYAGDTQAMADSTTAQQTWHARYSDRYKRNWGVDIAGVHRVSSGYMLKLSYRVVNVLRALPLFDNRLRPYLIDAKTGARLAVPAMENIGELRQTATPLADRTYFVIFGNPGKLVAPGDRVSIVIGDFRADEIIVD
ncbi:hypothetical protein [Rhodoferax sp.]|uniref:hypothetical protein n=1 Tax=Rhodoferax sp. TaxID=50421 RepID=UPI0028455037|nr:hypothetical protein [Rhodoferax sp.]MDR3370154.1 hypothetical protein [Rhodoferax sp.]